MRITAVKYICDICGRLIHFDAKNKRQRLNIEEHGVLIQESPLGDVCLICRPILRKELDILITQVRQQSLIQCDKCALKPSGICPNELICTVQIWENMFGQINISEICWDNFKLECNV
jgi:DNA-directed RNA polymerase subunit RPC12/RpoP